MSRLRHPTGSIIGRVDDIRDIRRTLLEARLVTLIGPGGVGKTTLAAEVAHEIEPEFDRVVLLELADAMDGGDLIRRVAGAVLSGPGHAGQAVGDGQLDLDRYAAALSAAQTLLVLDNCEHLVDEVAQLVATTLAAEPGVTVLTTSRRPLELADEVLWTVRPLDVPGQTGGPGVSPVGNDVTSNASVQLFLERTRQSLPAFELNESNRSLVVKICAAADGVPLVIELAAALVRTRPLEQILVAMTEHPVGLVTGRRDRAEHQRSLVASLDWSRQFLDEADKVLLNRLSVFVGGFTVEAACHVDPTGTGDGLARLVDHSLVEFDPATGRYYLLEVVRLDAIGRLDEHELAEAEQGHTAACLQLVGRIEQDRYDADPEGLFPRYELELPNLAAALRRAGASEDLATFRALLGPIAVWWVHGIAPEDPKVWEDAFCDGPDSYPIGWRGNVASALAFYWSHRGQHQRALSYATEAAVHHRTSGSLVELALDALSAGNAHLSLGDDTAAQRAFADGLEVALASGQPYPEMALRIVLARSNPDGPETAAHLNRARTLASAGFGAIEAAIITESGLYALRTGQLEEARRLSQLGLDRATANGYAEVYASALCGRAEVATVEQDLALAGRLFTEALDVGRRMVHEGLILRAESGLQALPDGWQESTTTPATDSDVALSDRELAVARLLRGDLTQREIADELYIAPSTVKTHIKSIYRKLGVTKRSYAVTRAGELGLFD